MEFSNLKRRRGVSKNNEKQKKRQDGKKKQLRKAPLSALGVLRRRNSPLAFEKIHENIFDQQAQNSVEAADPDRKIQCTKHSSTSARNPENMYRNQSLQCYYKSKTEVSQSREQ